MLGRKHNRSIPRERAAVHDAGVMHQEVRRLLCSIPAKRSTATYAPARALVLRDRKDATRSFRRRCGAMAELIIRSSAFGSGGAW
jgi:hypothetical protein